MIVLHVFVASRRRVHIKERDQIGGHLTNANIQLLPVFPKDFKEAIGTDVWMIDQIGTQHRTDPATDSENGPESDPELASIATGCVWNSHYVTLINRGDMEATSGMTVLEQFALAVTLIPAGKYVPYETHSDWLIEQWHDVMGRTEPGYVGLDREKCMPQWAGIMKYVDEGERRVQMAKFTDDGNDSIMIEATQLYAIEAKQRLEEELALPVDSYRQPEAPWS
jgi:hypothetical protein